jgi:hypothetical protein
LYKGKPNQLIDKLKIKNYFGGDSTKGEKINLYMNKGMKQIATNPSSVEQPV